MEEANRCEMHQVSDFVSEASSRSLGHRIGHPNSRNRLYETMDPKWVTPEHREN